MKSRFSAPCSGVKIRDFVFCIHTSCATVGAASRRTNWSTTNSTGAESNARLAQCRLPLSNRPLEPARWRLAHVTDTASSPCICVGAGSDLSVLQWTCASCIKHRRIRLFYPLNMQEMNTSAQFFNYSRKVSMVGITQCSFIANARKMNINAIAQTLPINVWPSQSTSITYIAPPVRMAVA